MINVHWPVKGPQDPYKKQQETDAVGFPLDSHYSCSYFLNSDGEQCVWSSYQLPLLSDGGVEVNQYCHSFSCLNYKPQDATVSEEIQSWEHWQSKMGNPMSHTLRAVLLQSRAEIILLQEMGNGELTGVSWSGWEGQERLVCLRLGSLFPADRGAVHSSAVWLGVTLTAAASSQWWEMSVQLVVPKYRSTVTFFWMFLYSEEK